MYVPYTYVQSTKRFQFDNSWQLRVMREEGFKLRDFSTKVRIFFSFDEEIINKFAQRRPK